MTSHVPTGTQACVDPDNPEAAMREARQRFVAAFPPRFDSVGLMLSVVGTVDRRGPLAALREIVHRMAGLAGMLGFPTVSIRARELEVMLDGLDRGVFDASAASRTLDALGQAFCDELASPPAWVGTDLGAGVVRRVMVVEDDETQRELVLIKAPDSPTRGTVVVAGDDPEVTDLVDGHLRAAGYQTILAADGHQALVAIDKYSPDLAIVDVMMPRMTGFDLLTALQRRTARPRVIVLSARGQEQDVTRAFALGADDYVAKPINPHELLARTERLFR
jgi:CheY-like chemotaxis protein